MSHYLAAISTDDELCVSHYKLLNTISQGTFAKVEVAQHILTGIKVAVKVINQGSSRFIWDFHRMKAPNHPSIIKLFEVTDTRNTL